MLDSTKETKPILTEEEQNATEELAKAEYTS